MTYRVSHGYQEKNWAQFPTWAQTLAFARQIRELYQSSPYDPLVHTVSVARPDYINPAEDAPEWERVGLTRTEWREWTGA